MRIILVMVASLDGKTTQGNSPRSHYIHSWTSKEDQEYFSKLIDSAHLIFMGRKTYDAAKKFMQHKENKLRVVFTKNPENFKDEAISNKLEFTNQSPSEVLKKFEDKGYPEALLVGGANLNSEFLKENLIDEFWLTIEPVVLGLGNPLFADVDIRKDFKLISSEKLNEQGTLLLKYKAI